MEHGPGNLVENMNGNPRSSKYWDTWATRTKRWLFYELELSGNIHNLFENRFIYAGLEPVLGYTEKSCISSYDSPGLRLLGSNKTDSTLMIFIHFLILFNFIICGELSWKRCDKQLLQVKQIKYSKNLPLFVSIWSCASSND